MAPHPSSSLAEQPPAAWRASWLFPLAWLALIHAASSFSPAEGATPLPGGLDKAVHVCEFAILAGLLWRPARARGWPEAKAVLWIVAFASLNGALDEWHQAYVPGRMPSLADVAADALGALLGAFWKWHREKAWR